MRLVLVVIVPLISYLLYILLIADTMTQTQETVLAGRTLNAQRDWNIIVNAISCVLLILILNYVRKVKSNANISPSDSTQNYVEAK